MFVIKFHRHGQFCSSETEINVGKDDKYLSITCSIACGGGGPNPQPIL